MPSIRKRRLRTSVLVLAAWAATALPGQAQAVRSDTEQRLLHLREQIALDQTRLSEAARIEESAADNLEKLNREIALREELTLTYRQRMRELSLAGDSLRTSLTGLEGDIEALKAQYRTRAMHAYKYGRLHDLALILASESINQMIIRARYLQGFGEQRQRKLDLISTAHEALATRREDLTATREETEALLREGQEEEKNLIALRRDRQRVIGDLRSHRSTLEEDLERKRAEAEQLSALMKRLTTTETARRRTEEAANPAVAAAYIEMSGSFLQNQGRLPWPADGAVLEGFGNRTNPLYGTTTSSPGILIATKPQDEVRSVFDGEVILVDVMPDYGTLVTIAHGEYKSVYSNFSMLYVAKGDRVKAGQVVGRSGTEQQPKGAGVFFGLFKNGVPVDPMPWLQSR